MFAARGSHASYLRPGTRDRMWSDPNDEADGAGAIVRPRLVRIGRASPRWIRWAGRWGRARARWWMRAEQDSPLGPAFQEERWGDPGSWARKARRCQADCDRVGECDTPENLLTGGALVAILGGANFAAVRRRRRGPS